MGAATPPRPALSGVLVLAAIVCATVVATVLFACDGWHYYGTPVGRRGHVEAHRWLRPSGPIGLGLGVAGGVAMLLTLPYAARKRWRPLARLGATPGWLEAHVLCGIVGPVLVTLHTSFKFNGIISVGYWLMATVWASGFVGRYLYMRIPKTMRGVELTRAEVEAQLRSWRVWVSDAALPGAVRSALLEFEQAVSPAGGRPPGAMDLFLGELRVRARLLLMRRRLARSGVDVALIHETVTREAQHATLVRRLAHLERTRRLFELWHVFHRPLVYAMFLIVGLHVAIAVYLGYVQLLGTRLQ